MPLPNALTIEEYAKRPLLADVNPNILMKDVLKPKQLEMMHWYASATDEELAEYDKHSVKARGISLTEDMQYLLSSKRSVTSTTPSLFMSAEHSDSAPRSVIDSFLMADKDNIS